MSTSSDTKKSLTAPRPTRSVRQRREFERSANRKRLWGAVTGTLIHALTIFWALVSLNFTEDISPFRKAMHEIAFAHLMVPSLTQLVYMGPLLFFAKKRGLNADFRRGLLLSVFLLILLHGGCYAVVMSAIVIGQ